MLKKFLHFIQYNNATFLILALFFLLGSGVFAQTETGQNIIGQKQSKTVGIDNTLLIEADFSNFDMKYKIEKIEEDNKYYYVTYTCFDLVRTETAWEYQLNEKMRKVSKKVKKDLGLYLAEQFKQDADARLKSLTEEQAKAKEIGAEKRVETVEYTGLVGRMLKTAETVFPGYEAVKNNELPSPSLPLDILPVQEGSTPAPGKADNLASVYDEYVARMDPDSDTVLGALDNCPDIVNKDQLDTDGDGLGDVCDEVLSSDTETQVNTVEASGTLETVTPVAEDTAPASQPESPTSPETQTVVPSPVTPAETPEADAKVIELPVQ